jgi:menaquinone-dependent protoporphyrinogen oxidase
VLEGENNMPASILVTYASRYGSTQEVAEVIAKTLREHGLAVDVAPVRDVRSLEGYRVVVFGAPLYIGHWPKDAQRFLSEQQEALMLRQVAIFTLGPIMPDEKEWEGVRDQLEQQMASYPWLKPVASELFGGRYDPERLRFPDSVLARLPVSPLSKLPARDARDWTAIRAWAAKVIAVIQPVAAS